MTPVQPLITIYNRHSRDCGEPPQITNDDRSRYVGYFQNEHGDQWIFVDDPATGSATLRCGDAKWSTVYTIHGPQDLPHSITDSERTWILACWDAAKFSMEARKRAQEVAAG